MDFQSKKFWVAQVLSAVVIVALFLGHVDFNTMLNTVMMIEGTWGVLDVGADIANGIAKKNGATDAPVNP